jgi:hypothetical protein
MLVALFFGVELVHYRLFGALKARARMVGVQGTLFERSWGEVV